MTRLFRIAAVIFLAFAQVLNLASFRSALAAGGSAKLYLSPSSAVVAQNSTLAVDIYEDSGSDQVNTVRIDLTYPTALLTYIPNVTNSPAFPIDNGSSGGNGALSVSRTTSTPVSGAQLVATVRFTVAAQTGTAVVSFAKTSQVLRASDANPEKLSTLGGSYTLVAQSASPSGSSSSGDPAAGSTDSTPPKISGIKVTNIGPSSATVEWVTSEPASSQVNYGSSKDYVWKAYDNALVKDHKLSLDSKNLTQGTAYHFMITSFDLAQNAATSPDQTFTTLLPPTPKPSNNSKYIWIGATVAVLIIAMATFYFLRSQGIINFPKSKGPPTIPPSPPSNPTAGPTPPLKPPNPTPPSDISGP